MRNDLGAFDMPQKRQSQALALRGSRNEPGNVGDGVAHVAGLHDAQIRHERGERVVRDLRLGRAHRSDQRRLARRGKAHERDVCDRLELENDVAFVARFAEQRKPGCTACPVRQRRVAQAARATRRRDVRVTGMTQIGKHRTRLLGKPCAPRASNTTVPTGTGSTRSAPFEPSFVSPDPWCRNPPCDAA